MFNNALISGFVLSDNRPQYQTQTWSGETLTRMVGVQYFTLTFKVTVNKKDRAELANFYGQYGSGKPFDMSLGWWGQYNGTQTTTVQATAAAAAGASSVTASRNTLEVGSLIQFNGHKKLYRITANNGYTISIYPGLIRAIQTSEVIKFDNLQGSFVLNPQNSVYELPSTNVMEITINATENIRG